MDMNSFNYSTNYYNGYIPGYKPESSNISEATHYRNMPRIMPPNETTISTTFVPTNDASTIKSNYHNYYSHLPINFRYLKSRSRSQERHLRPPTHYNKSASKSRSRSKDRHPRISNDKNVKYRRRSPSSERHHRPPFNDLQSRPRSRSGEKQHRPVINDNESQSRSNYRYDRPHNDIQSCSSDKHHRYPYNVKYRSRSPSERHYRPPYKELKTRPRSRSKDRHHRPHNDFQSRSRSGSPYIKRRHRSRSNDKHHRQTMCDNNSQSNDRHYNYSDYRPPIYTGDIQSSYSRPYDIPPSYVGDLKVRPRSSDRHHELRSSDILYDKPPKYHDHLQARPLSDTQRFSEPYLDEVSKYSKIKVGSSHFDSFDSPQTRFTQGQGVNYSEAEAHHGEFQEYENSSLLAPNRGNEEPSKNSQKACNIVQSIHLNATNFNKWGFLRKNFDKKNDNLAEHLFEIHEQFCDTCKLRNSSRAAAKKKKKAEIEELKESKDEMEMKQLIGFSGFKTTKGVGQKHKSSNTVQPTSREHSEDDCDEISTLTEEEKKMMRSIGGFSVFTSNTSADSDKTEDHKNT